MGIYRLWREMPPWQTRCTVWGQRGDLGQDHEDEQFWNPQSHPHTHGTHSLSTETPWQPEPP